MKRGLFVTSALAAILLSASAHAADIKVISAGAVRALVASMIDGYAHDSGNKVDITVGTTGQLRDTIQSGKPADLVIVSAPLMAELEKTGKLTPGSRVDLGRIGIGVVVRADATPPDVSTSEALKKALIEAKSVSYTGPAEGGTSGIHVMKVLDTFGITDMVEKKAVHAKGGKEAVEAVANGEADMAITLISEIAPIKGAKLAAPLPESLQLWTVYSSAIPANSTDPAAARGFVTALTSPAMNPRWKAAGFEPAQ
jgi:molybdate transport system substrate-binding protein